MPVLPYTLLPTPVPVPLPQDYLHSLGKARTAQVQKDARIGEAEAKRDAGIRVRAGGRVVCGPHGPSSPGGSAQRLGAGGTGLGGNR